MKKFAAAAILACALLAVGVAGAAGGKPGTNVTAATAPPITWGVADDFPKYSEYSLLAKGGDQGDWFYDQMQGANLATNRWTLAFNPSKPTEITELPFVARAAPAAQAKGIRIVLSLYSGTNGGSSPDATDHDPVAFCKWAGLVASTVKVWGIHDFIVLNEPNTGLYWSYAGGATQAASDIEQLLSRCYVSVHAADSQANVIGLGLSPRASGGGLDPLALVRDIGTAYKADTTASDPSTGHPLFDQLALHPYPNPGNSFAGTNVAKTGYSAADQFGIPDMDKVKQAVYGAFNGTAQPTTVSPTHPLTFRIDEVGWQTITTQYSQYFNAETATPPGAVAAVSEQQQADNLKVLATQYFGCDPTITDVELFLLVDEATRNGKSEDGKTTIGGGWQSGIMTAGGMGTSAPKLAYTQDAQYFTGRTCDGTMDNWTPSGSSSSGGGSKGSGGGSKGSGGSGKGSGGGSKGSTKTPKSVTGIVRSSNAQCIANRVVTLERKMPGQTNFAAIGSDRVDATGKYVVNTQVINGAQYRALVAAKSIAGNTCNAATSKTLTAKLSNGVRRGAGRPARAGRTAAKFNTSVTVAFGK